MTKEQKAEAAGDPEAATSTGDAELARAVAEFEDKPTRTEPAADQATGEAAEDEPAKTDAEPQVDGDAGKKPEETEWHGVPPETQKKFEKRLGREVSRRKELEELLDSERVETRRLKQEADERARAMPAGADGLLSAETDAELDTREDKLLNLLEWCEDHADGYEGKGTNTDPNLTSDEIRTKAHELRRELRAIPRARALVARRSAFEGPTREHYPDLLDAGSEMGAEAARILAQAPGLRALPDYKLRLGDMIAGRMAREGKTKPAETKEPAKAAGDKPKPKAPPAAPGASVAAAAVRSTTPTATKKRHNVEVMADGGFSQESLAAALEQG